MVVLYSFFETKLVNLPECPEKRYARENPSSETVNVLP